MDWLTKLDSRMSEKTPSDMLNLTLGFALCGRLLEVGEARGSNVLVSGALEAARVLEPEQLWGCDSAAVLPSGILQKHREGALTPAFAEYAQVAAGLACGAAGGDDDVGLYVVRLLLPRLGVYETQPPSVAPWSLDSHLLLTADEASVRALTRRISAESDFGARALDVPAYVMKLLGAIALHSLTRYKLELAGIVVRTLACITSKRDPVVAMCRQFYLGCQRADGRFGYCGPEKALLNIERGSAEDDRIDLAGVVNALWTLTETSVQAFSMYRNLK